MLAARGEASSEPGIEPYFLEAGAAFASHHTHFHKPPREFLFLSASLNHLLKLWGKKITFLLSYLKPDASGTSSLILLLSLSEWF